MATTHQVVENIAYREAVLREAIQVITHDRQDQYGNAEDCFADIAALWSVELDMPISTRQVARMMVLLKCARDKANPKHDNVVDIAGYAGLMVELSNDGIFPHNDKEFEN